MKIRVPSLAAFKQEGQSLRRQVKKDLDLKLNINQIHNALAHAYGWSHFHQLREDQKHPHGEALSLDKLTPQQWEEFNTARAEAVCSLFADLYTQAVGPVDPPPESFDARMEQLNRHVVYVRPEAPYSTTSLGVTALLIHLRRQLGDQMAAQLERGDTLAPPEPLPVANLSYWYINTDIVRVPKGFAVVVAQGRSLGIMGNYVSSSLTRLLEEQERPEAQSMVANSNVQVFDKAQLTQHLFREGFLSPPQWSVSRPDGSAVARSAPVNKDGVEQLARTLQHTQAAQAFVRGTPQGLFSDRVCVGLDENGEVLHDPALNPGAQ